MSKLQSLKGATTLNELALLLGFTPKGLAYIVYRKNPATKYAPFDVPKASGGVRHIQAPSDDLKSLQRNLSTLLQDCSDELNAAHGWKDQIAHGFKRQHSIMSNACLHRRRRWVFNLDLADFFDMINFGRVRGFFISNKHFSLHPKVATIIAQIACHNNSLPQGSPCSPVISNLIAHVLDIRLVKLASKCGCTYTRYADDLTFSTNLPTFPTSIASPIAGQPHSWRIGNELGRIITHSGFAVNPKKTRMQYQNSRQDVTGLVVNKKVNIRREYRKAVRSMVYSLFTTGGFHRVKLGVVQQGTLPELHGMLGHIDAVDLYNKRLNKQANMAGPKGQMQTKEAQYRRFLIFKEFYSAQMPVIVCEGKTDNVYLSEAIRSLAANFPNLVTVSATNVASLVVRIFKYPDTSTGRILGLHGGVGDLKNFILKYVDDIKKFTAPGLSNPVIILVDNDDGKKEIQGVIKNFVKAPWSWNDAYIHVMANLYVLPTPLIGGKTESAIEDFFSQQTLSTVINGKTFMRKEPFDRTVHYGKVKFAEHVKTHANSIDFTGFTPILTSLSAIITAHAATIP